MLVEYFVITAQNLTYCRCTGRVTVDQVLEALRAVVAQPDFDPKNFELVDFSAATEIDAGYLDVARMLRGMVKLRGPIGFPSHSVLYAPSDLSFGMARVFETLVSLADQLVVPLTVVRSESEALAALGTSEPSISSLTAGVPTADPNG